jgi:hypothetical protein
MPGTCDTGNSKKQPVMVWLPQDISHPEPGTGYSHVNPWCHCRKTAQKAKNSRNPRKKARTITVRAFTEPDQSELHVINNHLFDCCNINR